MFCEGIHPCSLALGERMEENRTHAKGGTMKSRGALPVLLCIAVLIGLLAGCERASQTPPPDNVVIIMQHIKDGYNEEDVEVLTADFADIMFSKGFTKDVWLETLKEIKTKLGRWESEIYLGEKDNVYTWRGTFEKGKVKCVIVLNEQQKVSGLWFR